MAEASFGFQMAGRQIRRIANRGSYLHVRTTTSFCFVLRSQPSRISLWYLLGNLGVFNRQ
jgi:hypothetical protein